MKLANEVLKLCEEQEKTLLAQDTHRKTGKVVELWKLPGGKFQITVDDVKWKHDFRNLQNAKQEWGGLRQSWLLDEGLSALDKKLKAKHPYLNNSLVHSGPHTREEASAISKEAKEKGQSLSIWHLDGPRTGKKSVYVVTKFDKNNTIQKED